MVRLASKCCHMLKQTFTASQSVFFFLNLLNTRCCTTEDRWAQTNQTLVHRQMLEVDHLWPVSNQPKKTAVQLATDRKVDLCTETWSLMISSSWSNQSKVSPSVIGDALNTSTLQRLLMALVRLPIRNGRPDTRQLSCFVLSTHKKWRSPQSLPTKRIKQHGWICLVSGVSRQHAEHDRCPQEQQAITMLISDQGCH